MQVEINWLAVAIATFVGTAIAGIWYQEWAFGKAWRKATGVTPKQSKQAGNAPLVVLFLANLVTASILACLIYVSSHFFENYTLWFALQNGIAAWLAFSATTLIVHNGFELKPGKLSLINISYQLVLFLSMALVIGLFGLNSQA